MKFITNNRRECGDPIMLTGRDMRLPSLFRAKRRNLLCSSQRMGRNEADVVRSVRPLGVINVDILLILQAKRVKFIEMVSNYAFLSIS